LYISNLDVESRLNRMADFETVYQRLKHFVYIQHGRGKQFK
jgi:hypothetical protein